MTDEILAVALYCKGCNYNFPVIGEYPIWPAWEITFGAIVISILISFASLVRILSAQREASLVQLSPLQAIEDPRINNASDSHRERTKEGRELSSNTGVLPGLEVDGICSDQWSQA